MVASILSSLTHCIYVFFFLLLLSRLYESRLAARETTGCGCCSPSRYSFIFMLFYRWPNHRRIEERRDRRLDNAVPVLFDVSTNKIMNVNGCSARVCHRGAAAYTLHLLIQLNALFSVNRLSTLLRNIYPETKHNLIFKVSKQFSSTHIFYAT